MVVGRLYLCSEGKYYNLKTQKIRELYVVLSKKWWKISVIWSFSVILLNTNYPFNVLTLDESLLIM